MITLLTCTGDRQHLFRRLERWMARQSLRWTNWIVVDDGERETDCTLGQHYVRCEPGLPPPASFARNMETGLREHDRITGSEFVMVIEDDDWYSPDYVASRLAGLVNHDLSGEPFAPFYHVESQSYAICHNDDYAALAATTFRAALIPRIFPLIDPQDTELDRRIWQQLDCSKHLQRTRHCVGLKGQGGRPGLTMPGRPRGFRHDPQARVLRKWIGDDTDEVLDLYRRPAGRRREARSP